MRNKLKRILKATLIALCSILLIGCLVFAEFFFGLAPLSKHRGPVEVSLPELSGRYPVGRRFFDWIDPSRPDPFHKSTRRELMVTVWYPAQGNAAGRTGSYQPGDWGRWASRSQSMMMRVRVQGLWSALLYNPLPRELFADIRTHAVEDAVISSEGANFPVLLFSPGYGAMPTEYTAMLEDIASHGYVVVGINPTDFVSITVFQDGRRAVVPLWNVSLYDLEKDYPVWVQDMLFVLDQVSEQNKDPRSPLFARLDMTRVGAFGHSFGGTASAGACQADPRITAGMNLDGAPHGNRSTWKFPKPFMLVQSDKRAYRDSASEDFYNGLTTGYRAVIKGSTHHSFTDEALLPIPEDRRKALVGTIDGARMLRATSFLICTFFDAYLQDKPPSLLNDASSQFPELTIKMHLGSATNTKLAP
jgi:predicted dienelactone hydrolase